ncbi:C39 family peptidase [Nocardioides aequoreus]|uniref:C39 family peptidase n=1 Tax=Nocardioides aequoreus TaxID=397278 RepID=UPI0012F64A77|nr:C39 family peptidase [Nocardioides aequoreus]
MSRRLLPLRCATSAVVLALGVTLLSSATEPTVAPDVEPVAATASTKHTFRQLTINAQLRTGTSEGVRISSGSLRIKTPVGTRSHAGKRWQYARWTSAWSSPGHGFSELIPSWQAVTPAGTFVQVAARVQSSGGTSSWKTVGSWATNDKVFRRTSAGTQSDAIASAATDVVRARPGVTLRRYQLRVLMHREVGRTSTPALRSVQAVASRLGPVPATSKPLYGARTLQVPSYSQMVHRGRYPQYGGGGQAWCSPTSLAMILGYYGRLPSRSSYAWVAGSSPDRVVPHLARAVYDYGYRGAGNWAFNTAYAGRLAGNAFVTRLASLRDAERFVAAGIPLAASISFGSGQLAGAPIRSTAGHLVVISGFTRSGDVVVNDPAAPGNASVRRTYDRGQLERAWLTKSRGTVYVVNDAAHPLPSHRQAR